MESQNLIRYIDLSLNPSLELIESFSSDVNKETGLTKDDEGRWSVERIARYGFDECLYTVLDNKIVNMTFNKWYGSFLRVGVNSYTLNQYRKIVFRPLWKTDGYMDLTHKKHSAVATGYFCSYFVKNKKIGSVVKMLSRKNKERSFCFGGEKPGWLSLFHIYDSSPVEFRYVPQYISYANNIGDPEVNYKKLIEVLSNDKI